MTPTAAEIFERAKSLSREERAELVQELLATLAGHDFSDAARLKLPRAVGDSGVAGPDAGDGIAIPEGGLRDYLRDRGRPATTSELVLLPSTSGEVITDEMVSEALLDD